MQLGYANIVAMFSYSIMFISLGMYVMTTCIPPPGHFVSRAPMAILGAPLAPLLLQCAAGFVCLRRFC